jgi:large repetitive protein
VKRRATLCVLLGLWLLPMLTSAAQSAAGDRYAAAIAPSAVQPLVNGVYSVAIANRATSTQAANNAHAVVPSGFVVDATSLSATTSASGSCTVATWGVALTPASSTIDAIAPPDAASALCPGGRLTVSFQASAPSAEGAYTWTTTLFHDADPFALQGPQPVVTVDGTPPAPPTLSSTPPNPANSSTSTFAFSDADPSATFRCRLDGGNFSTCTSPKTYTGAAEGPHTFTVKAVDPAGNESTATSYSWTIDLTPPPQPTLTAKPPSVTASTSATFSFVDDDASASFLCRLDDAAFSACTSPRSYSGPLAAGSHTFRVKARDPAGNESPVTAYTWVIDLTGPVVTIDPATEPPDPTNQTNAVFAFTSNKPSSTFECALDGAAFSSCSSPLGYSALSDRRHSFAVRATDSLGNTGLATVWEWTVDTLPPAAPAISSGPRNPTNDRSASFVFSGGEPGLTFACRVDGGGFAPCTSPASYSALDDGPHAFAVQARDAAGNTGPAGGYDWVVDTVPPETTITAEPPAVSDSSASFAFTSSEAPSSFACSLDGGASVPCASPQNYGGLGDGTHTFQVRATDLAGNTDPSPPSYAWQVSGLLPPDTTPPGPVNGVKRNVNYRLLKLTWSLPTDRDLAEVRIERSRGPSSAPQSVVYRGRGTAYVDKRFQNGAYYRYEIRSYDTAGNASRLVSVVVPPGILLLAPRDGGVVKAPPQLVWAGVPRATYYNVQLYRGSLKLLSAWPAKARLKMRSRWSYQGRAFRLEKGTYRWWVWPGFGARSKAAYGQLLGTATFVVR